MQLMYSGGMNLQTDVGHSSMMNAKVNGFDYGILGKSDFGRRPHLGLTVNTFYIYPQEKSGDYLILVCLPDMELKGLMEHPEWGRCTYAIEEQY